MRSDILRRYLLAAGFSLPLALSLIWGWQLERYNYVRFSAYHVAAFLFTAAALTLLTGLMLRFLLRFLRQDTSLRSDETESTGHVLSGSFSKCRNFLLNWLAIAVPNFIVLLGVYPGFFVYDAQDELMEVVTRSFNTHHPLLHVLLMGGTITGVHKLSGSWNTGIFVYLLLQMILITGIYAYALARLVSMGLSKAARIVFTIWYGFFPTVVSYTLCSTKDGLFAAFLTMAVVELTALVQNGGNSSSGAIISKSGLITLVISMTVAMLLRNNACYALSLFAAVLLLLELFKGKKNHIWIRVISCVIISFVIYLCLNKTMVFMTHASDSEHQESITVAIQSLGRTWKYHPEAFDDADVEVLFDYLSEEGLNRYELKNSDFLKSTFNNERYESDSSSFWRLWFKIGKKHPVTYLNSWLLTSYGLWYPFSVNDVYTGHSVFTFTYTESSYFGYETELPGTRESLIPVIDALYRWLSLDDDIQRIPVISLLFAPAFWFWIYAFCALFLVYKNRGSTLIPLLPLFLLWLTYLIGPAALVRYSLPFFTALPALWFVVSTPRADGCL